MLKFFQICFYTGALFTVVSFILGQLTHFLGGGGHVDTSADIHGGGFGHTDVGHVDIGHMHAGHIDTGHMDAGHAETGTASSAQPNVTVSPLKPIIIASFVTVLGGVGLICLQKGFGSIIALVVASTIAFVVSFLLYAFIVVPLYRAQNTSAVSQRALVGSMAKTTLAMSGSNYGKITYVINDNTYTAPAKSVDGSDIGAGVNVVIIDIKKNTFMVKEIKGGM